ncbi:hypothetical protein PR048_005432 [Dryococelus australis]|uniref:Retroviral polymerase SH3-like domain-containing protein n=1 Tax=Dryococelus australis TaxID=614101 RepID=A0ABQ9I951_9NEOP|nr:hypothetical protein PR048_005432 [Dryococelus australis]
MNAESVGRVVTDYCELKEVLYVPQLSKNILLVGSCSMEEKDSVSEALVAERKNLEINWHRRLCHISQDRVKVVSRIVEGMNLKLLFVGYPGTGYRLWDAIKREIVVRRDVVCLEGSSTCNEVNDTPVVLPVLADEQRDSVNESQEEENGEDMASEMTVLDGNSDSKE